MLRKVRIVKSLPKARTGYQVRGSLINDVPAFGGADYNAYIGMAKPEVSKTLTAVPREIANLEAEGGETVVGNLDGSKMPSFKTIKGPRHTNGGVPLLLPEDSFIFSDTKAMKIADPNVLKMFGKTPKKGGYTPAELSKPYDINNYRKILQDPNSDVIARKTAELMIKNYVMKLGALALAQESKKGFEQGIPLLAKPYMEAMGIREEDLIPELAREEQQESAQYEQQETPEYDEQEMMPQEMMPQQMSQFGGASMAEYGMSMGGYDLPFAEYGMPMGTGVSQNYMGRERNMRAYGGIPKYAPGGDPVRPKQIKRVDPNAYGQSPWEERSDAQGKYKYNQTRGAVEGKKAYGSAQAPVGGSNPNLINDLCRDMKTKGSRHYGKTAAEVLAYARYQPGTAIYNRNLAILEACQQQGEVISEEAIYTDNSPVAPESSSFKEQDCPCQDASGKVIPGVFADKDENGKCKPETCYTEEKDCYCNGVMSDKDANGNCLPCPGEEDTDASFNDAPQTDPQWWLQDTVNTAGAFRNLMGIDKEMSWTPRVDLEEPNPTFLDQTQRQAQGAGAANLAAQAAGQFAGAQQQGTRLSAIQAQRAQDASGVSSQFDNANVRIGDQFENAQVGVRNQENLMNAQMATNRYNANAIGNQQFENSKTAAFNNLDLAFNTGVTNKYKTDALNQMNEDVKTYPGVGGKVWVNPTAKTPNPTKPEQEPEEYLAGLTGYDPKVQQYLLERKYGRNKKYGGQYRDGGAYALGGSAYPFNF
jgi:hypothetical protein